MTGRKECFTCTFVSFTAPGLVHAQSGTYPHPPQHPTRGRNPSSSPWPVNPEQSGLSTSPHRTMSSGSEPPSQPWHFCFPPPGKGFPQIFILAMATRVSDKMPLSPTGLPTLRIPFASIVPLYFLQSPFTP